MTHDDTAARSLAHWSEAGRSEMEAFYALAIEDYRQLALALDWPAVLGAVAHPGWRLLDVACGSGKFPSALLRYCDLSDLPEVAYDLLDPSAFSIAEARGQLRPPFRAARELESTLQDLPKDAGPYDVVWATHALYALPPDQLDDAAGRFVGAVREGGIGLVAHATEASHYLAFDAAFRAGIRERTPYLTAEQVRDALASHGAQVQTQTLRYTSGTADRRTAEGFLQRCAFDDSVTLDEMESAPVVGDYLARCRTDDGGYVFEHEVLLLRF
ncbi:class I SAM-dependent methyltransferase [Jatrophihabitans endophyticus]|uniref:class I SAM-dependent methyltransferase n=1 Tax=Jatrophihabitans endophyticus TaxID=1206085 RepID=UPI001A057EF2|nr:class I SAM-dependent methyltransferase [Jatrophihabitans endophyticus]MBE7187105.1 class I SAM-dependent methyltransferase [Jatrophihabitans endophyticus]